MTWKIDDDLGYKLVNVNYLHVSWQSQLVFVGVPVMGCIWAWDTCSNSTVLVIAFHNFALSHTAQTMVNTFKI